VGILNGGPSNNTIDVDLDSHESCLAAPHLLPETGWVFGRPSEPRSHWVYRTDRPLEAAQEEFSSLDGEMLVELRGTGGQTLYPPSIHPSGETIAWHTFSEQPAEVNLADLQRAVREVAAVALLAHHWPERGTRQVAFLALVGGLLRAGWEPERVERFVEALAVATHDEESRKRAQVVTQTAAKLEQDCKTTGWPRLEERLGQPGKELVRCVRLWLGLIQTIKPGASSSAKRVRTLTPYQPFPVEALPAPLAEFVRQGALALRCDPAFVALPVLSVAASAIGNTRTIRLKRGWTEPSIIWSVIVGDSGTLKSPAYLLAVSYLFNVQKRLLEAYRAAKADFDQALADYRAAKRAGEPGVPPEAPVFHRVLVSDTTIERLAEVLEDNPRGVLVARDELAGWLGSFSRYKGMSGGTDLPNWLEMFRAGTVVVDRKTGERRTLFVPRAAVSVTGGIQPSVLAHELTAEFFHAGLPARLVMALPPKLPKKWSEAEVTPEVEQAYQTTLDKVLALDFDLRDDEPIPHILRLSAEAYATWVAFFDDWAQEQDAVEGELASAFSKLEGYAARFALLHHIIGCVARGETDLVPVARESVEAGITLCRWFAAEARRIYSTLSESTEQRDTRRLVEFIRSRGGSITARQLQKSNSRKYPTSDQATSALDSLVDAGLGEWAKAVTTEKGGQPAKCFILHPTPDTTDTTSPPSDDGEDGDPESAPNTTPPPPTQPQAGNGSRNGTSAHTETGYGSSADCSPGGSVGSVGRRTESERSGNEQEGEEPPEGGSVGRAAVVSGAQEYLLVQHPADLATVATALDETTLVGIDTETTGLDPRADRVRLLSLTVDTIDGGTFVYLVDCVAVNPSPLWEALAERELVVHNAAFDLAFLSRLGFTPAAPVHDTMILARLLEAGGPHFHRCRLADCCERYLNQPLDKKAQRSNWAKHLTADQLRYAARDAHVLVPLYRALLAKVREAGLGPVADIETRALPAFLWLARSGVAFDREAWAALTREAEQAVQELAVQLDAVAPSRTDFLVGTTVWNWDSPQQVQAAFAAAGVLLKSTDDDSLAGVDHPMASLLRTYRAAQRLVTAYGADWSQHAAANGRIYANWNQLGSVAGRTSGSAPNLQQVPRDPRYRRCFSAPPGRVLIKADYSQLQLRIAAKIAEEPTMLGAYARHEDLHTLTARQLTGKTEVTKADRQLAKAVNFGLLFGLGAKGLCRYARSQYGLDLSESQTRNYRAAFFRSYAKLATWHRTAGHSSTNECRTLAGRRRLLDEKTPYTHRLNTPVQGTEADGAKLAMALLWERRDQFPGTFPVLFNHDEIVVECDIAQVEAVASWLKQCMLDGMAPLIDPVPVEVEVSISRTWGGGE
jgi:DNA polymerase I-like protein with 3'-5' exonuclease and polymerase domains